MVFYLNNIQTRRHLIFRLFDSLLLFYVIAVHFRLLKLNDRDFVMCRTLSRSFRNYSVDFTLS